MATVLITGGTGLIGRALTNTLLEKGYHVIVLTRTPENKSAFTPKLRYAGWDIHKQTIDSAAITNADYIIHLAGAGVADQRWTRARKQEILDSRVNSGKLLVKALQENKHSIKALICSSAIGWYGPDPVIPNLRPFDEDDPADDSFLGSVCRKWEASIDPVVKSGIRVVILRTGIVLSSGGGALKEFLKPLRFGIATILGSGRQIISWIHINDLVRLYITAIEKEEIKGIYNAVAPKPVSNKEFTIELAKIKKGRFYIPVHIPSFILKIVLGEMSIEVLKSATVSSSKIQLAGFDFQFPSIASALHDLEQKSLPKETFKN